MPDRYDAVILGLGPGGEVAARRLIAGGMKVALVERELIGGECTYWACVPTKTLLRPAEAIGQARRGPGLSEPPVDLDEVLGYRDYMTRGLDDSAQISEYEEMGADVFKGEGRLAGRGAVEVEGRRLEAPAVVVATGSVPRPLEVPGAGDVPVWTNRDAAQFHALPESAVVVGGGPVGVELGQFLARFGCEVSLVQHSDRVLNREDERVSEVLESVLASDGMTLHTGREAARLELDGPAVAVELDDGTRLRAAIVLNAVGRTPRSAGIGLDTVGLAPGEPLGVDGTCRAAPGLWAVGDVTDTAMFTHVAKYMGRIAGDDILDRTRQADYRAVPRVVFTDPEVAAVGLNPAGARAQGIDVATASLPLSYITRPWTYEKEPPGELGLVADRAREVLVGAWAVAPAASEWIHQAVLAIRAEVPVATLLDVIPQFPTFSEALFYALEALDLS